jgi:hypothetical protein
MFTITDQIREAKRINKLIEFYPDSFAETEKERNYLPAFLSENKETPSTYSVDLQFLRWELVPSKDPFDISFAEFQELSLVEIEELIKMVYETCKNIINDAWASGYLQIAICDKKIIFQTQDAKPITADFVKQLAKEHNKACYVFSAPDTVEESVWTPVDKDDAYPTIKIYLGPKGSTEKGIINNVAPVFPDLDTGNPCYKIFDANRLHQELQKFSAFELRIGTHLGGPYSYYTKDAKICVEDIKGNINSFICTIRLVRDWSTCAVVVKTSPLRTGFVGRDLLRALRIRLKIDPLTCTTQILDVS